MRTPHVRLVTDRRPVYSIIEAPPATLGVSFVVPVKDDAEDVVSLATDITTAMRAAPWSWECVWVDDRSTDGTGFVLDRVSHEDPRHRVLSLAQSVGQSAALAAGLSAARGELIVTLDGDGQSDPRDAPTLILMLVRSGADMVHGRRELRCDRLLARLSSRAVSALQRWLTGEDVRDLGCSLRAFRREVVQGLFAFRGLHRFLPTLARLNGARRILEAPVRQRRPPRRKPTSFLHHRLWVGLADALAVRWLLARAVSAAAPRTPARRGAEDRP